MNIFITVIIDGIQEQNKRFCMLTSATFESLSIPRGKEHQTIHIYHFQSEDKTIQT
jgi:hypothetical protein